jgi:hypothetical protein
MKYHVRLLFQYLAELGAVLIWIGVCLMALFWAAGGHIQ